MKISKNQLKSMIMEELQSVVNEQSLSPYGPPMGLDPVDSITFEPNYGLDSSDPRYQPLETEEDRRFTGPTRALAAASEPPPLGTSTGQGQPEPLGVSTGTSTPTNYGAESFKDKAGFTYTPLEGGGYSFVGPGGNRGIARPGSNAAKSIASVQAGKGSLYGTQGYAGYRAPAAAAAPAAPAAAPAPAAAAAAPSPSAPMNRRQLKSLARQVRRAQGLKPGLGAAGRMRDVSVDDVMRIAGARGGSQPPARRDIEEMIYEALLEEFGDK